jgi:hypothetical protein
MADQNLGLYSPKNVNVDIAGRLMGGFGNGTFVETERNNPNEFSTKAGSQGDFTFIENPDKSGLIRLHIKQNAGADQQHLTGLLESKAVFPVNITHKGTYKEIISATHAMIKTQPRKSFADDEETRVWEIAVGKLTETNKP